MMKFSRLLIVLLVGLLLVGCGGNGELPPAPTTEPPPEVLPTDTPAPTEPVPVAPGLVFLVVPPGTEAAKIGKLEAIVGAVASAHGLNMAKSSELTLHSAPENLVMVISISDFDGLAEMADALPGVKFVVGGASELEEKPNLKVLGGAGDLSLSQAFLAGYIAAVQSEEYRIGIISVNDAAGQDYRESFLNGGICFCGSCATLYPPYEIYPAYVEVAPGSDRAALEDAARVLIGKGVNMMMVAPSLQDADFYQYLAQNGVRILGTDAPPAGLEGHWVASVLVSSGVSQEEILGAILDGEAIPEAGSKIEISYTGVGEARLAHFALILDKLESGAIDPLGLVD